ncbi:hypothetical protein ElyMa_000835300 [Elysia marginata]|uniref:Uncharacterized protein n=1 Tax=Elysia marginata TaxID=1093978 RepID=A0AAV4H0P2_9GAST|nr:hypothetical protein ElyMa_000835300 [Elysia marginata]
MSIEDNWNVQAVEKTAAEVHHPAPALTATTADTADTVETTAEVHHPAPAHWDCGLIALPRVGMSHPKRARRKLGDVLQVVPSTSKCRKIPKQSHRGH